MGKIPAFSTWPRIEASASSTWPRNGVKRMQSNESAKLEIPIFKEDFYFENKDKLAAKNCNSVMNLKSKSFTAEQNHQGRNHDDVRHDAGKESDHIAHDVTRICKNAKKLTGVAMIDRPPGYVVRIHSDNEYPGISTLDRVTKGRSDDVTSIHDVGEEDKGRKDGDNDVDAQEEHSDDIVKPAGNYRDLFRALFLLLQKAQDT